MYVFVEFRAYVWSGVCRALACQCRVLTCVGTLCVQLASRLLEFYKYTQRIEHASMQSMTHESLQFT